MADAPNTADQDHVTSVTVARGATLTLDVSGGRADDPSAVRLSLRAEGGTAIGVPTVAVPELRAAGLVL